MQISWWVSQSLLSLSLSPVVLVPLVVSWTLMVRVVVAEHGEGDVWGVCGVAGGVDGEGVVSGHWGCNICGLDVAVVARVL